MADDLKKKQNEEQLQDEQLDEAAGGQASKFMFHGVNPQEGTPVV